MQTKTILHRGNPLLRQLCSAVNWPDETLEQDIAVLQQTLSEFRSKYGFGRAIAAPQLGIHKRIIALNLGATPFAVINPEITWRSNTLFDVWDDCLSVPDCIVKVRRHTSISLVFQDEYGHLRNWHELPEDLSELLQHEIDHLDGVLMTERAIDADSIRPISEHASLIGNKRKQHRLSLSAIQHASRYIAGG